jgi:hypothetical protein
LRFLAAAPDPPGSEVDLGAAPFDPPSWMLLLLGVGSHLLLLLFVCTASTSDLPFAAKDTVDQARYQAALQTMAP